MQDRFRVRECMEMCVYVRALFMKDEGVCVCACVHVRKCTCMGEQIRTFACMGQYAEALVCTHVASAYASVSLPVVVVRGQHHAGAGVGVAGHPGAVHRKHHQQHQHQHGDDGLDVGAQALLRLLLLRHMLPHLARLWRDRETERARERGSVSIASHTPPAPLNY